MAVVPASPLAEPADRRATEPVQVSVDPSGAVEAAPDPAVLSMLEAGGRVMAGVDVGANSVHLLVGLVTGHRLDPLVDESVFLGLGDRVDSAGTLGPPKRAELVAALVGYAQTARRLGAERIAFVGTEPMRRAGDAATAVHEVALATAVPLCVLDPREEAELTLIGVTQGQLINRELAIVDVGGGSSQIVRVGPGHPPASIGLGLGGARLTATFVANDPPAPGEIEMMRAEARRLIAETPAVSLAELIAVGGTASNLVKVLPAATLDRRLDRGRLRAALDALGAEPSLAAAERYAINPTRARLLPAGAVILETILSHFGLEELTVSEAGIREGIVLAQAHAGIAWRDALARLAHGWAEGTAETGA
jgi:exopolyphosphatase / guanosine-5'-triphosphate,3'-diphosphate pyrophosphatase